MKSLDASLISANMFLNAAHPSSLVLPAGTIMVLRFLLTDASDTYTNNFLRKTVIQNSELWSKKSGYIIIKNKKRHVEFDSCKEKIKE